MDKIISIAQGPSKLADAHDVELDNHGMTNPNLHIRVDTDKMPADSSEIAPRKYTFSVQGVCSYRTTDKITHDDDADNSDIP